MTDKQARWIGGLKQLKANDEILYLQNELEMLKEEHNALKTHVKETERQLSLAKREAATTKQKLAQVSIKLVMMQLYEVYDPNNTKYKHPPTRRHPKLLLPIVSIY